MFAGVTLTKSTSMESSRGVGCDLLFARLPRPANCAKSGAQARARVSSFESLKATHESTNFSFFNFLLSSTSWGRFIFRLFAHRNRRSRSWLLYNRYSTTETNRMSSFISRCLRLKLTSSTSWRSDSLPCSNNTFERSSWVLPMKSWSTLISLFCAEMKMNIKVITYPDMQEQARIPKPVQNAV